MEDQTAPTKGQLGEVGKLAEGVAKELGLSRDLFQIRILGQGGKIKKCFDEVLREFSLPINPYEGEQTEQVWFYPKGLEVPSLEIQAGRIKKAYGIELTWPDQAQNLLVPSADGIGLWPTLSVLGKHWSIADPYRGGYSEIILAVCDAINQSPDMASLNNYCKGKLDARYVRIHAEVLEMIEVLEKEAEKKGHNCLVMPVNLGDWKNGTCYSPRNARWQCLNLPPKRLPIETVAGWSLLTGIRERLTASVQLNCDFAGVEYDWDASGSWSGSLYAGFEGDEFEFRVGAYNAGDICNALFGFPGALELAA